MKLSTQTRRIRPGGLPAQLRQRGVTLIEFLVGITVGLLVVLAAVGSLVTIRGSARTMNDSVSLEQQASLVMMQIGQQISQTGAINACLGILCSTNASITDGVFFDNASAGVGQKITINNPTVSIYGSTDHTQQTSVGSNPSVLIVSYAAPIDNTNKPTGTNCIGSGPQPSIPADGAVPAFTDRIVNKFSLNVANNELVCGDGIASSQPIASHVADMQVTYLVVNGDSITYADADSFNAPPAGAGATANNWVNVKGVQVCLEMRGDRTERAKAQDGEATKTDCSNKPFPPPNDGRMYRFVRQTFYLRNTN